MFELGFAREPHIRLVRQTEVAECGLACLAMIGNFYGLDADLPALRRRFMPSMRGSNLATLVDIADRIGLTNRPVSLEVHQLHRLHVPCILHWDMNHFVVLEKVVSVAGNFRALVHNPDGRSIWFRSKELSHHFTGVALELNPSPSFEPTGWRNKLRIRDLWSNIFGLKRSVTQIIVLSILLQFFVLASPYYMQISLDQVVITRDVGLLNVLALGFGFLAFINASCFFLRSFALLVAGSGIGSAIASNLAHKLLRLPIEWFERRHVGDILSRFRSVIPIQNFLTQGAVAVLVDGVMAILTLAFMLWYSIALTIVTIVALLLYGMVRFITYRAEQEAAEESIIAVGKEQSTIIESLRGITTLRLHGREAMRHAFWYNRFVSAVNADAHVARISIWQKSIGNFFSGVEYVVTIWLAIRLVLAGGGFSIGMAFAYLSYKAQFVEKFTALVEKIVSFRMLGLHLERLSDIALSDEDQSFDVLGLPDAKVSGAISVMNLSFRYSEEEEMVLNDVSFTVNKGDYIAITGRSGGGKTTLLKIMLGLLTPDAGEVKVDDIPINKFGLRNFRCQISAVLQEDSLFSGTLAENIAIFDDYVDMKRVIEAAKMAAIHSDIIAMPMQYETYVGDMGSTLSGGQKQRVLLARALYRQPKILFMDEGTAHLDGPLESMVNSAIAEMGITRIVIAHRVETIGQADRVLVLDNGRIAEKTE